MTTALIRKKGSQGLQELWRAYMGKYTSSTVKNTEKCQPGLCVG